MTGPIPNLRPLAARHAVANACFYSAACSGPLTRGTLLAAIRPVAQTLVDNRSLQADTVHLATDVYIPANTYAIVSRISQILDLEGSVAAPADTTAALADATRPPRYPSRIEFDVTDELLAAGLESLVCIAACFLEPKDVTLVGRRGRRGRSTAQGHCLKR